MSRFWARIELLDGQVVTVPAEGLRMTTAEFGGPESLEMAWAFPEEMRERLRLASVTVFGQHGACWTGFITTIGKESVQATGPNIYYALQDAREHLFCDTRTRSWQPRTAPNCFGGYRMTQTDTSFFFGLNAGTTYKQASRHGWFYVHPHAVPRARLVLTWSRSISTQDLYVYHMPGSTFAPAADGTEGAWTGTGYTAPGTIVYDVSSEHRALMFQTYRSGSDATPANDSTAVSVRDLKVYAESAGNALITDVRASTVVSAMLTNHGMPWGITGTVLVISGTFPVIEPLIVRGTPLDVIARACVLSGALFQWRVRPDGRVVPYLYERPVTPSYMLDVRDAVQVNGGWDIEEHANRVLVLWRDAADAVRSTSLGTTDGWLARHGVTLTRTIDIGTADANLAYSVAQAALAEYSRERYAATVEVPYLRAMSGESTPVEHVVPGSIVRVFGGQRTVDCRILGIEVTGESARIMLDSTRWDLERALADVERRYG